MESTSFVSRVRAIIVSVLRRVGAVGRRKAVGAQDSATTIAELKAEIQEIRALHQRVAELTDIVAEVLIPLADRDDARVQRALVRFQRQSF